MSVQLVHKEHLERGIVDLDCLFCSDMLANALDLKDERGLNNEV